MALKIGQELEAIIDSVKDQLPDIDDNDEIEDEDIDCIQPQFMDNRRAENFTFDDAGIIQHPLRNANGFDSYLGAEAFGATGKEEIDWAEEERNFFEDLDSRYGIPQSDASKRNRCVASAVLETSADAEKQEEEEEEEDISGWDSLPSLDLRGRFSQLMAGEREQRRERQREQRRQRAAELRDRFVGDQDDDDEDDGREMRFAVDEDGATWFRGSSSMPSRRDNDDDDEEQDGEKFTREMEEKESRKYQREREESNVQSNDVNHGINNNNDNSGIDNVDYNNRNDSNCVLARDPAATAVAADEEEQEEDDDDRPPHGGEFRGHSAHTLRMIELVRAFHETYDIQQNDETTNPGGMLSNNFAARMCTAMLVPAIDAAPSTVGDPFDADPVVRAARRVRDAAVAERRRAEEGGEGTEEEEKGQREANLRKEAEVKEEKERIRREREKQEEEDRKAEAAAEARWQASRQRYLAVAKRNPDKYGDGTPPPLPGKSLVECLNERIAPGAIENALAALRDRGDTSCPWMDAIDRKIRNGEDLSSDDFSEGEEESVHGGGDNRISWCRYKTMRNQQEREQAVKFLRRHEELTGEKYSLEVLGYPPEPEATTSATKSSKKTTTTTTTTTTMTTNRNNNVNPFKPKPPPIPIANQKSKKRSSVASTPEASTGTTTERSASDSAAATSSSSSTAATATSSSSYSAQNRAQPRRERKNLYREFGTDANAGADSVTSSSSSSTGLKSSIGTNTLYNDDHRFRSTGTCTGASNEAAMRGVGGGGGRSDLRRYAEIRRSLDGDEDGVRTGDDNKKRENEAAENDPKAPSTPFWKLEADRQHFESVKRILGLQPRQDDDDDEESSEDDGDDDDNDWEALRRGVKSGQGWGRFRSDDNNDV